MEIVGEVGSIAAPGADQRRPPFAHTGSHNAALRLGVAMAADRCQIPEINMEPVLKSHFVKFKKEFEIETGGESKKEAAAFER